MKSLKDRIEEELEPIWGASVAAVSTLFGLWPVLNLYQVLISSPGGGGVGWFVFLIFAPLAFGIVVVIVVYALGFLLCEVGGTLARTMICSAMVLFFLLINGIPHPIGICVNILRQSRRL